MASPDTEVRLAIAPTTEPAPSKFVAFACRYTGGDGNGDPPRPDLARYEFDSVPDEWQDLLVTYRLPPRPDGSGVDIRQRRRSLKEFPQHLRNITVIDSVRSGTHRSSDLFFRVLLPILEEFGLPRVYVSTTGPDTIALHARTFSSSSTIVLMGGDTSVHEFVNALTDTTEDLALSVVVIPTGTGNALASSVGIVSPATAVSRLLVGQPAPLAAAPVRLPPGSEEITLGGATPPQSPNDTVALVVVSWGFHAALVADAEHPEMRKLGIARFRKAAETNAAKTQDYQGSIEYHESSTDTTTTTETSDDVTTNTQKLYGPHAYVLLTTVTSLEPTFRISPASQPPSSRHIHMVQIDEISGPDLMEIMGEVYDNASHVRDPRVRYKPLAGTSTITITDPRPDYRRICIDGRIISVPQDSSISVGEPSPHFRGWRLYMII